MNKSETCPVCGKTHTFFVPDRAEIDTPLYRCVKAWEKSKAIWFYHSHAEKFYYLDVSVNSNYLPKQLKNIRLEASLTQEQLAEMIGEGFNKGFISAVENGKRQIKQDLIERWAACCNKVVIFEFA